MAKTGTIVIDPGHGGLHETGGSSPNNAISTSGVLEKNITLRMAFLVRDQLALIAAEKGHDLTTILTRNSDVNLGLSARANVARDNSADLFLSIHCNGIDRKIENNKKVRGTETLIRPAAAGNTNHATDMVFAQKIQRAVFTTIRSHDPNAKNRGVKDQVLGVLKRSQLGATAKGCLLELEFIDLAEVDQLLNIGPTSPQVRESIAKAIAAAIIDSL